MNHYTPDDWVKIIQTITTLVAAVGAVIAAWNGKTTRSMVGAIHHETVTKPKMAAIGLALDAAAKERNA